MPPAPPGAVSRRAGFTLLELLVVVALVASLAALLLGAGRRAVETGRIARARAELATLSAALDSYRREHGDYPRTTSPAELLQALTGRRGPTGEPTQGRCLIELARYSVGRGRDPFTEPATELLDPWGRPYRYAYRSRSPWTNPRFVIYSAGPDGADAAELLPGGFADSSVDANLDNLLPEGN